MAPFTLARIIFIPLDDGGDERAHRLNNGLPNGHSDEHERADERCHPTAKDVQRPRPGLTDLRLDVLAALLPLLFDRFDLRCNACAELLELGRGRFDQLLELPL